MKILKMNQAPSPKTNICFFPAKNLSTTQLISKPKVNIKACERGAFGVGH